MDFKNNPPRELQAKASSQKEEEDGKDEPDTYSCYI